MTKSLAAVFVISASALLTGCSSLNQSTVSPALSTNIDSNLKADISVGQKISGKASTTVILGLIKLGDNKHADGVNYGTGGGLGLGGFGLTEDTKSAAAYKAIKAAGADVLLAPTYVVTQNGFGFLYTKVDAEVTGYAGTVKGVKQQ